MNVALETRKPEWRDPEYGHRLKQLLPLAASDGGPLVVVLGSSRSQMGFSPSHLGESAQQLRVYNLSQAGAVPLHQLLNLQRLLADGVKPDCVLVEVRSPILAGREPADALLFPQRLSIAELSRMTPYCDNPVSLRDKWLAARITPWSAYRSVLMSHWLHGLMPWQHRQDFMWKMMQPGGWLPYPHADVPPKQRAEETTKAMGVYRNYLADFRIAPLPDRALRDLLTLARERGIRVAFFTLPESATFRTIYTPEARTRIHDYFTDLNREFGTPYFDTGDWLPDETLYADGHHLLRRGAIAFCERFGHDCLAPWVQSR